MGDVYYYASITIAAVSSSSGSQSLLQDRPAFYNPVLVVFCGAQRASLARRIVSKFGVNPPAELLAKLTSRISSEERFIAGWSRADPWDYHIPGPLFTRGWTYQERLLSTRVTHFTDECIIWERMKESIKEDRRMALPSLMSRWSEFWPNIMAKKPTQGEFGPRSLLYCVAILQITCAQRSNLILLQFHMDAILMRNNIRGGTKSSQNTHPEPLPPDLLAVLPNFNLR